MAAPKQTKRQRIDEAREQARLAREKRERRQKRLKVIVPSLVTLGVLALAAIIVVVVAVQPKPAAAFPGGPKNMASDGIVFVQGTGDTPKVAETAALKKGQKPKATEWSPSDDVAHIVTYIDLSCPACKSFEAQYSESLQKLVADGSATLEVHPIAILDSRFTGPLYSTRAANVMACVSEYVPSKFFDAMTALYDGQAEEQSAGLSNDKMISLIRGAGVENDDVDACIRGNSYKSWVTAATQRATSDTSLAGPQGFSTPTVLVDGKRWDGTGDFLSFVRSGGSSSGSGSNG